MHQEQTVAKKKFIQSDGLLYVLVVVLLAAASLLLGYMEQVLGMITTAFQFIVFAGLLVLGYVIITKNMTSFQYVIADGAFTVYRYVGKSRRMKEQVPLRDILFLAPYTQAKGERGREHALCITKKQDALVIGHDVEGKRQWLLVNLNESMEQSLKAAIAQQRKTRKDTMYGE